MYMQIPRASVVIEPFLSTVSPGQVGLGADSVLSSPLVLDGGLEPCIDDSHRGHGSDGVDVQWWSVSHGGLDAMAMVMCKRNSENMVGGSFRCAHVLSNTLGESNRRKKLFILFDVDSYGEIKRTSVRAEIKKVKIKENGSCSLDSDARLTCIDIG